MACLPYVSRDAGGGRRAAAHVRERSAPCRVGVVAVADNTAVDVHIAHKQHRLDVVVGLVLTGWVQCVAVARIY